MIKYPLADMLKVRQMREKAAITKLAQAQNNVEQKMQAVSQKEEALNNYRRWRQKKQKELFAEIEDKMLSYGELEYVTLKIQWIRTGEKVFIEDLDQAREDLNKAHEMLEEAKSHYNRIQKDKLKLDMHQEIWLEEQQQESDRKEEDEIEESHTGGKYGFNRSNSHM